MKHLLMGTGVELEKFNYRKEDETTLIQAIVQIQVSEIIENENDACAVIAKYLGVDSKSKKLNANLAYILEAKDFIGVTLYNHLSRDFNILKDSVENLREQLIASPNWYVHHTHDDDGNILPTDNLVYAPIDGEGMIASGDSISLTITEINMLTTPLNMKAKYEPRKS